MNDHELSSLLDFIKTETENPAPKTATPSSDGSSDVKTTATESESPKAKTVSAEIASTETHAPLQNVPSDAAPESPSNRKPTFMELLDETIEEPAVETSAAPISPERANRIREILLGLILVLFAIIGIVFCVQQAVAGIQNSLSGKTAEQTLTKAIEQTVLPLVVMDIPPFASSEELEESYRISAAIWSIIVQNQLHTYPESMGMYTIPEGDITTCVLRLFGGKDPIVHQTISFSNEIRFYYDNENKVYYVNDASVLFSYRPVIRSIHKSQQDENILLVEVAYAAEQPSWRVDQPDEIAKVVEFTLYAEADDTYRIDSMRQLVDDTTENAPY
ncbi:MAG: hypothetical protein IKM30_00580 [Oscillospiraceae bacterium]|nr:hypothetical protein [Oscillospiraceae bacterium]